MRRAIGVILAILLLAGSALSGAGHVHAAPGEGKSGLHVDHVHHDPHPHAHDAVAPDVPSFHDAGSDHHGDDAIPLMQAWREQAPKRMEPAEEIAGIPCAPAALHRGNGPDRGETPPREPILHARPPGRAPPA